MAFKLTKERISTVFFKWIFWMPGMLFYIHLLLSIRSSTAFLDNIKKPFIYVFILLLALCWIINRVTIYLNKHEPILPNHFKRIVKQLLFGILLPLGSALALIAAYDSLIDEDTIQITFLLKELCLTAFFLYFFNGIYILHALDKQVSIAHEEQTKDRLFNDRFLVYRKGYYAPINLIEIAMVYQSEGINWVLTFEGESYISSLSFKEANSILKSQYFFEINRTQTIHKDVIEKFRSGSFGSIELTLRVHAIKTTVSKGRAANFRKWLKRAAIPLAVGISK
ncbi:LytTR family transcriptional regulator DNA-binding domain-containing protein [Pedobacter insulae]|nr:LytTR family transcriptional regulator DNA-binding domain-containing protein [Pedobacter insulae]